MRRSGENKAKDISQMLQLKLIFQLNINPQQVWAQDNEIFSLDKTRMIYILQIFKITIYILKFWDNNRMKVY